MPNTVLKICLDLFPNIRVVHRNLEQHGFVYRPLEHYYTGLRGLYRWTEPGLFLLNHCSNYPKVSVCCLFIKNWIVVKGHSIPRGSQWKNRSDKESWGFTIDTAVNEHLTWSASLWVGPGLTQFWKHVQKVWMCGRCPRPTGPVSSRRSISSSVEHCLGSRRAVCCLF